MKVFLPCVGLLAGLLSTPAALALGNPGGGCSNASLGAQLPDQISGLNSDPDAGGVGVITYDSFRPTAALSTITSVCWWGVYQAAPTTDDGFTITYLADAGGLPGAPIAGPFAVNATRAATGELINGTLPEYLYQAEHPPVMVEGGSCTWISIVNDSENSVWAWETSGTGDRTAVAFLLGEFATVLSDIAFSLDIDIESDGCTTVAGSIEPFCSGAAPAPCNCGNHGAPGHGCANAVFPGGALLVGEVDGEPSLSDDRVTLVASDMTPLSLCLFLQAPDRRPGVPFGDGVFCLDGSVRRLAIRSTGLGVARYPGAFDPPLSQRGAIRAAGDSARYQVLFRDARQFGPCGGESQGLNWTNALEIVWGD